MNKNRIYLSPPHLSGTEINYIQEAFSSNWIAPLGPNVDAFEHELEQYLHIKAAAALSSGTAALHLALIIAGVQQDDFVICPSFTFSASANPIVYQKAIPVFVDAEMESWNMDPEQLEEAIQFCLRQNKKPKAIIVVHLYGMPANMPVILKIASDHGIPVIEDAAESLGSKLNEQHTGTFGNMSVLSFNGNKIITTSGGGALISNDEDSIKKAKFLATQARDQAPHYEHSSIGYNYRLSNICAGIGRGQLSVIEQRIAARRANFNYYQEKLQSIPGIAFQPEPENAFSNRWLTAISINPQHSKITPQLIQATLASHEIEARPIWKPLHLQPVFKQYPAFLTGNSENLFNTGICLPSGSALSTTQLDEICALIAAL